MIGRHRGRTNRWTCALVIPHDWSEYTAEHLIRVWSFASKMNTHASLQRPGPKRTPHFPPCSLSIHRYDAFKQRDCSWIIGKPGANKTPKLIVGRAVTFANTSWAHSAGQQNIGI